MERIQRAIEIARQQRGSLSVVQNVSAEPDFGFVQPPLPPEALPELAVPRRFPLNEPALRGKRVVFADDATPAGHAFRMLRSQLRQVARDRQLRIVGVVSAADGEGKTLTAVNLSFALAADPELSIVLIELDLRRPSIAGLLGIAAEPGLHHYVNGNVAATDINCGLEGVERLIVIAAGQHVANSSIVLAGARMQDLLRSLRSGPAGQIVIVDLPPALLSDDVLTIAPALDGVIIVGREGHTRRADLRRLRELLRDTPVVGTVLTHSSESEQRGY